VEQAVRPAVGSKKKAASAAEVVLKDIGSLIITKGIPQRLKPDSLVDYRRPEGLLHPVVLAINPVESVVRYRGLR
jgi:hypothetical protein